MVTYCGEAPRSLTAIDPAVGDGELLAALATAVLGTGRQLRVDGFDTDPHAVSLASDRLRALLPPASVCITEDDALTRIQQPQPVSPDTSGLADLVIANPPYVRTQGLGPEKVQELARKFSLSGRVDLYQAFIKAISWTLKPGGIAGLILPNRFMTVRAGAETRRYLLHHFDILEIWDLGDTRLFAAAVLPSVLILRKNDNAVLPSKALFHAIYTSSVPASTATRVANSLWEAFSIPGLVATPSHDAFLTRHGVLDHGTTAGDTWRLSTDESSHWLDTVAAHTACTFGDVGKARVGVKSTADDVFLRSNWNDFPGIECLRPVTTHHVAQRFRSSSVRRQILYPYLAEDGTRQPVPLDSYPVMKAYLESHRAKLESRSYLIASGRPWYELWVPQVPALWALPKVIFRDISEKPTFWMDLDTTVVNGDCYWITADHGDVDALWLLLAVANSRFIEEFYDHRFHNKLYAGRRRFMTQYVASFPLPDRRLASTSALIAGAKAIYQGLQQGRDMSLEADTLERQVYASFGLIPAWPSSLPATGSAASGL